MTSSLATIAQLQSIISCLSVRKYDYSIALGTDLALIGTKKTDKYRNPPCILMDSLIHLGIVHCTYQGVSGYSVQKYCILLSEELFFTFTNSVDPDAIFHLGLHCLPQYPFGGFQFCKD